MKVAVAVQQLVKAKLQEGLDIANQHYKGQHFNMPVIRYDVRGTTAGLANCQAWMVRFNSVLLMENQDEFIARTVPHELAHLITSVVYPDTMMRGWGRKREIHGCRWQSVMRVLGVSDSTRCHQYDVKHARVKERRRFEYKCTGCDKTLSVGPKHHKALLRNPNSVHHKCGWGRKGKLILPTAQPAPTPIRVDYAKKFSQNINTLNAGTKQDRAMAIYRADPSMARLNMIQLFMSELGMTNAGASTYYYNCQKRAP